MQILLDFGLAEELTPRVRKHFISFLHAISKGDARAGTRHMLHFGAQQTCTNPAAFERDMTAMFAKECNIYSKRGVDVDRVCHTHSLKSLLCLPCGSCLCSFSQLSLSLCLMIKKTLTVLVLIE